MAQRITRTLLAVEAAPFEKWAKQGKSRSRKDGVKVKYCGKIRYRYMSEAALALSKAKFQRLQAQTDGAENHRSEKRIYWHEQCNSYHLTSQPLLAEMEFADVA